MSPWRLLWQWSIRISNTTYHYLVDQFHRSWMIVLWWVVSPRKHSQPIAWYPPSPYPSLSFFVFLKLKCASNIEECLKKKKYRFPNHLTITSAAVFPAWGPGIFILPSTPFPDDEDASGDLMLLDATLALAASTDRFYLCAELSNCWLHVTTNHLESG